MMRYPLLIALTVALLFARDFLLHVEAQNPSEIKVTFDESGFGDSDDLLHLVRRSGKVHLPKDATRAFLELHRYSPGVKVPKVIRGTGCSDEISRLPRREIRFSVQAVDLDWLRLAEAKPGHCRLVTKVQLGPIAAMAHQDVSKADFDFYKGRSGGTFSNFKVTDGRLPLYWLTDGNSATSASTVEQVVALNKSGNVAVVYLCLEDPK